MNDTIHRKIAKTGKCVCGGDIIWLYDRWVCMEIVEKSLRENGYTITKEVKE